MRRVLLLALVVAAAAFAWNTWSGPAVDLVLMRMAPSPHARYAVKMRVQRLFGVDAAGTWLAQADDVVASAEPSGVPFTRESELAGVDAKAWRFPVRRGQRVVVASTFAGRAVFLDLLPVDRGLALASAGGNSARLQYDAVDDRDVVLRAQPPLDQGGRFSVTARLEPSLHFPVQGVRPAAVAGSFGGPRDAGRRRHQGVDIFAPRGTAVVAAADRWVTGSTTNRLGGNVVWVWSPARQLTTYYAHLERHAVTPGQRVGAGDVLGFVGTTGNARGTPPHLHFGVYVARAGAVDPLPFLRVDTPRGPALPPARVRRHDTRVE